MLITEPQTIETYYKALLDRESNYVGIFFVAVKTTSVFCIATCRARKPKRENVLFYTSANDALENGYRPCKICKPTENTTQPPEQVERAIEMISSNPNLKVSDALLKEHQISPTLVRRWFKSHYGVTFHKYQRMQRIQHAKRAIQSGQKTIDSAFDSGYESLSGFGYTFKKLVGKSPQDSEENTLILLNRFTTPLGPMFVCATEQGVCLLEFSDRAILEKEFSDLQRLLNGHIMVGENEHTQQAQSEITEYFIGKRHHFDVSLHTPGTPFQQSVWHKLHTVNYGETATYMEQAEKIGNKKAVRAVAAANGANRIAIIVPCHRIVASNGKLTGYGGGLERKRWLLTHERKK